MMKKLKLSVEQDRYDKIQELDKMLGNGNISLTFRTILDRGLENFDTAILLKESNDSSNSQLRNDFKNLEKDYKNQSNRLAKLEVKNLTESVVQTNLIKHFVKFGSLTDEDIERIEKASKRELFQELNSKKED
ncbi:hypothetical protein ALC152_05220 [Arcobacter sp. 15-2]|uniref:hypothetical protein n=1 Tax=Arcobacter sp. 15-2 TaxID=3374109 RepID=UPI00399D37A7